MEELAGRLWPEHLSVSRVSQPNAKGSRFSWGFLPSPTSFRAGCATASSGKPRPPPGTAEVFLPTPPASPHQLCPAPSPASSAALTAPARPRSGTSWLAGGQSDLHTHKAGRGRSAAPRPRAAAPSPQHRPPRAALQATLKQGKLLPAEPRPPAAGTRGTSIRSGPVGTPSQTQQEKQK